jgi:hypothetical protein
MNLDELMKQKELLQQKLGLEGENLPNPLFFSPRKLDISVSLRGSAYG